MYPHFQTGYVVPVDVEAGLPHGGADAILNEHFYGDQNAPADKWGRTAGHEQGAASVLVGVAGVESIKRNQPVNVSDLVGLKPGAVKLSELV